MAGFNPLAAVQEGYDFAQGLRDKRTQMQAGNALASGDYTGAKNALYSGGMLEAGQELDHRQQAQESKKRADQLDFISKAGTMLYNIAKANGPEAVAAGFDHLTPIFKQMGADDAQLGQLRQTIVANPDVLQAIVGKAEEELKVLAPGSIAVNRSGQTVASAPFAPARPQPVAPGGALVDPQTGQPIYQAPERTEYHNVPEGGKLVATGGGTPGIAITSQSLATIAQRIPGATINSGLRSPERNAEVKGVANSYHLTGQALDVGPPPGMSVGQLAQQLKGMVPPGVEVIPEPDRNHVHLEPAPGVVRPTSNGARVVAEGNPKRDTQTPKEAMQLRKEFNNLPDVKQFQTVATQYGIVNRLASQPPTAANDVSLIFAYMKLLDPTSVVREGEFATAQNATGVPAQIANTYNKLMKGERLNPEQRRQFTAAAGNVFNENKARYNQLVQQYQGYAAEIGLDPGTIQARVDPSAAAPPPKSGPQAKAPPRPGEVVKGYRFKGGDPSKPSSWQKVG